jgi:hypothetical protein
MELDHHNRIAAIATSEGRNKKKQKSEDVCHVLNGSEYSRMLKQVIQQGRRSIKRQGVLSCTLRRLIDRERSW